MTEYSEALESTFNSLFVWDLKSELVELWVHHGHVDRMIQLYNTDCMSS